MRSFPRLDFKLRSQPVQRPNRPEVGHNETNMGRTLQLGDVEVDETKLAEVCRRSRVRELSFFGSAARGHMRPDSDVDLLVEFLPDAGIDLVDYAGLMLDLSVCSDGRWIWSRRTR